MPIPPSFRGTVGAVKFVVGPEVDEEVSMVYPLIAPVVSELVPVSTAKTNAEAVPELLLPLDKLVDDEEEHVEEPNCRPPEQL